MNYFLFTSRTTQILNLIIVLQKLVKAKIPLSTCLLGIKKIVGNKTISILMCYYATFTKENFGLTCSK